MKQVAPVTVSELSELTIDIPTDIGMDKIDEHLIPDRPPWEPPEGGVPVDDIFEEAGVR
jgi:hypothetical protein